MVQEVEEFASSCVNSPELFYTSSIMQKVEELSLQLDVQIYSKLSNTNYTIGKVILVAGDDNCNVQLQVLGSVPL